MITSKLKVAADRCSGHATTTQGSETPATAGYEPRLEPRRRGSLVGFLLFSILLTAAFVKSLFLLAIHAAGSELHSYILLVPFVSVYLIYIRRNSLPREYAFSPGWAMIPLLAGLLSLVAASTPGLFG